VDDVVHDIDCDLDEDCVCAVRPSWWGQLPLPPVRPRYHVVQLTGFTAGGRGGGWAWRKERTTWHVHDRLNEGRQVGPVFDDPEAAERYHDGLEYMWDAWLRERGYDLAA